MALVDDGVPLDEDPGLEADHGGEEHEDDASPTWIRFRSQGSIDNTRAEIVHEVGHGLGLHHTPPGVVDIMAAVATSERHVTPPDCTGL